MDWKQRKEEIRILLEWANRVNSHEWHGTITEKVNGVIAQEQSMLAKAEEEKKELISQLKSNWQMIERYECKDCDIDCDWFQQGCEIRNTKQLLKKYSDKKEDSK